MSVLTPSQVAFCSAIVQNRLNGTADNATQAYRDAFVGCAETTALSAGSRLFHKPKIQEEIRKQLQAHGITREYISGKLIDVIEAATHCKDLVNERGAAMDLAKLCGFLIDKQEVKAMPSEENKALRNLVDRALAHLPSDNG